MHYECCINIDRQGNVVRSYHTVDEDYRQRITDRAYYKARKLGRPCQIVVHVDPTLMVLPELNGLDIDTEEEN